MYLPHEIKTIKEKRRLKQKGIELDTDFDFSCKNILSDDDKKDDYIERSLDDSTPGLEPFSITKEINEGLIDKEGNYIQRRLTTGSYNKSLSHLDMDPWMRSIDDKKSLTSSVKNYDFYRKRPCRTSRAGPDIFQLLEDMPLMGIVKLLISKLDAGKTPIDCLKYRSGNSLKPKSVVAEGTTKPPSVADLGISELAHALTMMWKNVYYMTREEIQEAIIIHECRSRAKCPSFPRNYEFMWLNGDEQIYGPVPENDIIRWIVYDYISDVNPVILRELGSDGEAKSQQWTNFKETDIYTFVSAESDFHAKEDRNESNVDETPNEVNDDDMELFGIKHRKTGLIGVRDKCTDENNVDSDDGEEYEV